MTDQQPPDRPAPGWYPDPSGSESQRYFDGNDWTEHFAAPQSGGATAQPTAKKGGFPKWAIPVIACLGLGLAALVIGVVAGGGDEEPVSSNRSTTTEEPTTTEAATTEADDPTTTEAPTTEPAPTEPEREQYEGQDLYRLGESDMTDDFTVTLNTIEDPFAGGQFDEPAAGSRFIGVEVTMVNNGSDSQTFSSFLGTEVKDTEGRAYDPAFAGLDRPQLDGDVAPGATRRGWIVFEVPNDAGELVMRLKGSLTATGVVFALY